MPFESEKLTPTQIRERIDHLKKSRESVGWQIVSEIMRDEIVKAAYRMADGKPVSMEEIHFQRGALWASRRLVDIHDALLARLENDLLMATANTSRDMPDQE